MDINKLAKITLFLAEAKAEISKYFNRLSRAHERYRRQTDMRQPIFERNVVTLGAT